ncbi:pyrroline-5-carboxylate reductase dimerization domain-containing protein, partial [Methylophilaceae bacterium]|nr:pyrroline-5-carboxylate reductase dimerization domain-containing protein [Methylophilaceae bacterium]
IINQLSRNKLSNSDIILLAVKPAQIKTVCIQIKSLANSPYVISIAAGVNTSKIIKYLEYPTDRIARAMPNLCAKKGKAITGIFYDGKNNEKKKTVNGSMLSQIFTSIGQVLWVKKESDLDSVTAISGSGPAYIYYIMNVMIEVAEEIGLKRSDAQRLVAQTIIGAGETGKDIDNLESEIVKVSSKGGTTEKAIDVFKQKKLDTIIKQAVKAAYKRSKELSK